MMNFLTYSKTTSENDLVIVSMGHDRMFPLILKKNSTFQIRGGAVSHNAIIGKPYGGKVYSTNGKSWITILNPTPELWTVTLPHRTQILYMTDISMITMYLELRPGSIVCESGTGSGSLSHSIARTIAPTGQLYTFEFHKERADIARDEFQTHGLTNIVITEHRDVCKDGFGLTDICDAVFLDLPKPWDAIAAAKLAMKNTGGRICSFSPCIEQVQLTCEKMSSVGFSGIEMIECLYRPFDARPCVINVPSLTQTQPPDNYEQPAQLPDMSSSVNMYTCAPHRNIPGHTGFLTFATLLHK